MRILEQVPAHKTSLGARLKVVVRCSGATGADRGRGHRHPESGCRSGRGSGCRSGRGSCGRCRDRCASVVVGADRHRPERRRKQRPCSAVCASAVPANPAVRRRRPRREGRIAVRFPVRHFVRRRGHGLGVDGVDGGDGRIGEARGEDAERERLLHHPLERLRARGRVRSTGAAVGKRPRGARVRVAEQPRELVQAREPPAMRRPSRVSRVLLKPRERHHVTQLVVLLLGAKLFESLERVHKRLHVRRLRLTLQQLEEPLPA
mmetsp:Transcript_18065/g.59013  ORF Transcript_18065/g.59013 Transcript_18065/m.59013 type:complete len:262 (-) Transcript_18065:82-867(-)